MLMWGLAGKGSSLTNLTNSLVNLPPFSSFSI